MEPNLMMPGNPRYQPKELVPLFGYDNLMRPAIEVGIATMQTLGEFGAIPAHDIALLTPDVIEKLLTITTSQVDHVERTVTHHDIRALTRLEQEILPEPLRRWAQVPLTSYDRICTAQALQFQRAYKQVLAPKSRELIKLMIELVRKHAYTLQIGRTHGQHALPITVGFWLATILSRICGCVLDTELRADDLDGKISGAVGAYNAQVALKFDKKLNGEFEREVLRRLGLHPAGISTQILPPESISRFLFACLQFSAALGQFGRDGRHLMRSEIAEIQEEFVKGQVGSSTMAHKRNPINFENLEGTWLKSKSEFNKVLDCMLSDHQRDLVGSCIMRDFPIIVINLTHQLNTLLKPNKQGVPFISRITVNVEACQRNFKLNANVVMAEPMYIALQMAGYDDAHKLVNEVLMPETSVGWSLFDALYTEVDEHEDGAVAEAYFEIPEDLLHLLQTPAEYTGRASQKALEIAKEAEDMLNSDPDLSHID